MSLKVGVHVLPSGQNGESNTISVEKGQLKTTLTNTQQNSTSFSFDYSFSPKDNKEFIFSKVWDETLSKAGEGDVCVISYGHPQGNQYYPLFFENNKKMGIISLLCQKMNDEFKRPPRLECQMVLVWQDTIYDLLVYSHEKKVALIPQHLQTNKLFGRSLGQVIKDCNLLYADNYKQMAQKLNSAKKIRPRLPKAHIITSVRIIFEQGNNKKKIYSYFFVELNGSDEKVQNIILGNLTNNRNYQQKHCIDKLLKYILKKTPLFMLCYIIPNKINEEKNKIILNIGQQVKDRKKQQQAKPEKKEEVPEPQRKQQAKPEKKEEVPEPQRKQQAKPEKKEEVPEPQRKQQAKPEKKEEVPEPQRKQQAKPEKKEEVPEPQRKQQAKPEKKEEVPEPQRKQQAKPEKKEEVPEPQRKQQAKPEKKEEVPEPQRKQQAKPEKKEEVPEPQRKQQAKPEKKEEVPEPQRKQQAKPEKKEEVPEPQRKQQAKPEKKEEVPEPQRKQQAKPEKKEEVPEPQRKQQAKPEKKEEVPEPQRKQQAKPEKKEEVPEPQRKQQAKPEKKEEVPEPQRKQQAKPEKKEEVPEPQRKQQSLSVRTQQPQDKIIANYSQRSCFGYFHISILLFAGLELIRYAFK